MMVSKRVVNWACSWVEPRAAQSVLISAGRWAYLKAGESDEMSAVKLAARKAASKDRNLADSSVEMSVE